MNYGLVSYLRVMYRGVAAAAAVVVTGSYDDKLLDQKISRAMENHISNNYEKRISKPIYTKLWTCTLYTTLRMHLPDYYWQVKTL